MKTLTVTAEEQDLKAIDAMLDEADGSLGLGTPAAKTQMLERARSTMSRIWDAWEAVRYNFEEPS